MSACLSLFAQTNITALRVDPTGNIIAGTDPGGLVLRVSPDGKVFTLFDSSLREIRDLALIVGMRDVHLIGDGILELDLGAAAIEQHRNRAPRVSFAPLLGEVGDDVDVAHESRRAQRQIAHVARANADAVERSRPRRARDLV